MFVRYVATITFASTLRQTIDSQVRRSTAASTGLPHPTTQIIPLSQLVFCITDGYRAERQLWTELDDII